ncbi:tRNA1(Val) (adenine(37)-N6)-methyltransferase [Lonepinella sp. BR2271]|uniref:tRNA1(Val) (adenine(37)-N6)-methyltransferase n=1 Tax=Lonepinella sp. BR2271 TaxID=3434550 RepID=UPI003F6E166B
MSGFRFKQFQIQHDRCAMKVGTDGILLGAWADIQQATHICDLGTGSGLVALMLAQRTHPHVQIVGVEIDPDAAQQAQDNVNQSPWKNRVQILQQDIREFALNCGEKRPKFDLIVANPPYFAQGVDCRDAARNTARYTQQQTHIDWLHVAEQCLTEQGKIQFILPFEQAETLIKNTALFCNRRCEIITKQGKSPHRMLVSFEKRKTAPQIEQLMIYDENHQYTAEFVALTAAFYLNL